MPALKSMIQMASPNEPLFCLMTHVWKASDCLNVSRKLPYRAVCKCVRPPKQCSTWPPCIACPSCPRALSCRVPAKPECPACAWHACDHALLDPSLDRSRQMHPRQVLGRFNFPPCAATWALHAYITIHTYIDTYIQLHNATYIIAHANTCVSFSC